MAAALKALSVYTIASRREGHEILRDNKVLKTPGGEELVLPAHALAETIAEEWRQQAGKKPVPAEDMPMTQLAFTAIDITRKQRAAIVEQVAGYAAGDLLCHRAEHPEELVRQQQKLWQPVLDWCAMQFDAILRAGEGVMPVAQSPEALKALRRVVESCDDFALTGLKQAAEVTHSLVLGLALMNRHLTAGQVFAAAECDALFQMQKWGEDPAAVSRHAFIRRDLDVCEKLFELLR